MSYFFNLRSKTYSEASNAYLAKICMMESIANDIDDLDVDCLLIIFMLIFYLSLISV
jgi:hypothetical protein